MFFFSNKVNDIKKCTIFDSSNDVDDENLVNAKIELILYGNYHQNSQFPALNLKVILFFIYTRGRLH